MQQRNPGYTMESKNGACQRFWRLPNHVPRFCVSYTLNHTPKRSFRHIFTDMHYRGPKSLDLSPNSLIFTQNFDMFSGRFWPPHDASLFVLLALVSALYLVFVFLPKYENTRYFLFWAQKSVSDAKDVLLSAPILVTNHVVVKSDLMQVYRYIE